MNESVLSISLDAAILLQNYADARQRQLAYAKHFRHYVIIVLTDIKQAVPNNYDSGNMRVFATNVIWKPLAIFQVILSITKLNRKYHFDVVTAQDPLATGLTALIISILFKIPFNIQLHSTYCFTKGWQEESLFNRILSILIKLLISQAHSIRVVSKTVYKHLIKIYPDKNIHHIPMIVDLNYFYQKLIRKKEITNFVSIGRLAPEKNFILLIKGFAQAIKNNPQLHLTIIGGGIDQKLLENKIKALKMQDNISIAGMLPRNKVRKMLWLADCFILTSNYEGWGLVFIEALTAGLPIIATKVGFAKEELIHKKSVLLIERQNTEDVTKAILFAVKNPNKMYAYASKGQKLVMQNYDKSTLLNQWVQLLQETKYEYTQS